MAVEISVLRAVTDDVVEAFARLIPQLSTSATPPDRVSLERMLTHDAVTILLAREDSTILGTLTLVTFPIPTGLRARIEDVVVDAAARGKGVAALLTQEAIRLARNAGAVNVDLTSRPSREAANRLYQRLGFTLRESNVYRFTAGD